MKRIGKNVLIFILGTVFSFIINVAAETLIDSGAVTYTNASTNQTTVNGALNELF